MVQWRVVTLAVGLLAAACAGSGDDQGGTAGSDDPAPVDVTSLTVVQIPGGDREPTISALEDPSADGLPEPLIDLDELRSGGPPPDGIPSIDEPRFLHADDVTFLAEAEPVLALEVDGEARAYPLQILMWHEIVNDTIAGVPVAVTYCPLCNTAIAFDRRLGDRTLSFGTSGMLYNSALVMYDRQTESLWSHFTSQALAGVLTGERLETFPVAVVSWADWHAAHAGGIVLSRDTGVARDYGRNPYPGYDDIDNPPFLFQGEIDGRLAGKERIVGLGLDQDPVAVLVEDLSDRGVLDIEVDGAPVTVWHRPGTVSALDGADVAEGRDIGATGVFDPAVDGQRLTFERARDGFTDRETGTIWDILGRGLSGPLTGEQLAPVEHVDTFWFAWAAHQPDTRIEP